MRIVKQIDSRIWVNFTRNGLTLRSRHEEPPHTDVSRNLATVVVRGVLPGLRRRTGLLPSGPKSSFQMRASFVFHLETKVLESGGRVCCWLLCLVIKHEIQFVWGILNRHSWSHESIICSWSSFLLSKKVNV